MRKSILFSTFILLFVVSCKKEYNVKNVSITYLQNIKVSLKDSLNDADYANLDFTRSVKTYIDTGHITLLRIAFKEKSIANDFVLVQIDESSNCIKGRIVSINGSANENHKFNGYILIASLHRKELVKSDITNGYINAFLPDLTSQRTEVLQDPYIELPEVVVVGSYHNGGISWATWYSFLSFFNDYDYGGGFGFYGNGDPFSGGSGGGGSYGEGNGPGGGTGGGGSVLTEDPIFIDFENQYADPAIEIEKYMKCFSDIPDAGSTGSIEIFTDIPVNGDPSKFFDWSNGSPGHSFIQLRKQNGTQSVSQNIGFYPKTGWKTTISPAPIDGKFVDNQGHEFNASYKINLTAAQVQTAVTRILYLSRFVRYDIDDYNCTDWALDVFNQTASVQQHLDILRYDIPGGEAPNGTSTPNGLYNKLVEMKNAGGQEAANIVIPVIGWVGQSGGPCN